MKPKNCSTGFWYNEGADACEDVDECDDHVLPACGDGEICINRLGSVECLPENQDFKCDAGYQKINRKCVDVNECETSLACQSNQTCVNYLGGFKCVTVQLSSTNPEIRLNLDAAERVDTTISPVSSSTSLLIIPTPEPMDNDTISEIFNVDIFNMTNEDSAKESKCTEGTCKAGETCIKDGPLIKCKLICQPNQNLDFINNACVNISDCKNGKSCEQGQDCVKFTNGTYSCQEQCSSGFKRDDASGECVDVDECMFFANRCDKFKSRCVNRIGSYECECFTGYHHPNNEHKQICVDIDECANGTHNCLQNSTCYNKDGSFECRCHHGYRKQNGTCVDIDECAGELKDSCPGECINRPGGYVCHVCPFGFKAGSKPGSCMRINNCTGPKKCKDGEMCVSLIHRHRCVNTRCPSLYHDNQIQPK